MTTNKRLAIDVGGTFLDFVSFDPESGRVTTEKVSASGPLEERFFDGWSGLGLEAGEIDMIVHGSTMVINTIVQEAGARVAVVTTAGFRDVLELGRGNRAEIYNLFYRPPQPLVPRYLRFEVPERLNWRGEVLEPLDTGAALEVVTAIEEAQVEAVAIVFLHAYANPDHEKQMGELLRNRLPSVKLSLSSEVVREWREYERTSTTVLNAYTQPKMARYLAALDAELDRRRYRGAFTVMQSSGGVTSSQAAQDAPIRTVQSGPAGGVIGARQLGATLGLPNLVAADVGGTTFDVALIAGGSSLERSDSRLDGRPVLQPTIDIVSIGAGGGSVAWLDPEQALHVGPASAGADPGPACFARGGSEPTVTDAQLVLGYLDATTYLGSRMALDLAAAEEAIERRVGAPLGLTLERAAAGIVRMANMNMVHAIRQVTIERGHDPREFSLICYGGGGGLFVSALLDELEFERAIVPVEPATFSAWGLLNADCREDVSRTFVRSAEHVTPAELHEQFQDLVSEARTWLERQAVHVESLAFDKMAELRYLGQEHTVKVPILESDFGARDLGELKQRFDQRYLHAYAHNLPDHKLEFVALRLAAVGSLQKPPLVPLREDADGAKPVSPGERRLVLAAEAGAVQCPLYQRQDLRCGFQGTGPAVVEEWNATTFVQDGQRFTVDAYGNLVLERSR